MGNENPFLRSRTVRVSPEALAYAREFSEAIGSIKGGNWIACFDWAASMIVHQSGQPDREVGPCLSLSAYRRHEVPVLARDFDGGLEFAVSIPADVLARCLLKRIDLDDSKQFRLVLS